MWLKSGGEDKNNSYYKCCFCCHVRTGTLLLGLWYLFAHIVLVALLAVVLAKPMVIQEMTNEVTVETDGIFEDNISTQKVTVYVFEPYAMMKNISEKKDRLCFALILTIFAMLICLLLVLGTIQHKAGYLMPFFCLQVFDFCINCLTAVGYFSYAPNIKLWLRENGLAELPMIRRLMCMDEEWLVLMAVLVFIMFLSIKAYLIGVVWACYKYIQMRNASRASIREYHVDPDTEMLLPPKYEDVIKIPRDQDPSPPAYSSE